MSTRKGSRGGARGGGKPSVVKGKAAPAKDRLRVPADMCESDSDDSNHRKEAFLQEVLDGIDAAQKASDDEKEESDDDIPELAPVSPRDGPRDMPCDCGDETCTKRIYFKEKWPIPSDMLERMYNLECTAVIGRLVHINALSIDDAKEALEIMDSKDDASRAECWRNTWRVDVLTGEMEVPLCLMDAQLNPALEILVADFYREIYAVLMNEGLRARRAVVQKMWRNPDPSVAGPTYPYPWSLRYLYQHLANRDLSEQDTKIAFLKVFERLEYRYEWEAIGGTRPATLQHQKKLLKLHAEHKEAASRPWVTSPPKAAKVKPPSSPPKKPQAQATAPQKPAAAGGGATRPSSAAKPKPNTTGKPFIFNLDDEDSDEEPPDLVPFNPRNPPQETAGGGGGQTGGATRETPTPAQPSVSQQPKPVQPKAKQPQAPQQQRAVQMPVQAAAPRPVQPTQAPRPTAAIPQKDRVPFGGMNGGAAAPQMAPKVVPPRAAQAPVPPRAQAVPPQAPPSSSRMQYEVREMPARTSGVFEARAQAEARLNKPADLRAKAEAELLAMLAAEEEEKAKAAGTTTKKKKKNKRTTRGKGRQIQKPATAVATSAQTATVAPTGDAAASSSDHDSDDESDAEEAPINRTPEPEPEPPRAPIEPLRQLSLPGAPPTLPKELQELDNSGTDAREVEYGAYGEVVVPDEFLCPVSLVRMVDPVVAADGNTYERDSIERWIARASAQGKPLTSPLTNEHMGTALIPNNNLRKLILAYCEKNGVPYFQ